MAEPTIKAKLILDTAGGGLGGISGGGTDSSGLAGAASNNSLGKISKWLGIIAGILDAFQAPLAMLSQILKVLMMFLKPISDIMLWILKPVLLMLLKFLTPILMKWNEFTGSKMGEVAKDAFGASTMMTVDPIGTIKDALVNTDWSPLWESIKIIATAAWDSIKEMASSTWDKIKEYWSAFSSWTSDNIIEPIKEYWNEFTSWISSDIIEPIKESFSTIIEWFDENIIEPIKAFWQTIVTWFNENIIQPVMTAWKTISDEFTTNIIDPIKNAWVSLVDAVTSKINSMFDWFNSIKESISSWWGNKSSSGVDEKMEDGIITSSGRVIKLDPQDNIMASKSGNFGGGTYNITVNVSTLDPSSVSRSVITSIADQIAQQTKRSMAGRTSYGVGV